MAPKAIDPVTGYATDVRDGKVIASKLVRLACLRHLKDLEDGPARGLDWRPQEAQDAIDFFAECLCLPEETDADDSADAPVHTDAGTPFVLSPFQQFIVGSLFGWYTQRNRRFRVAYVETAKGSGKTPLGAGILIYGMVADGERGAQNFCAAVTKDQAKLAFTDAERMVKASPHLSQIVDQKVNNLAVLESGSFIRPISSEKRGLDGKRVHIAVIDELHEHATPIVVQKMRAGTKGRRNALIFIPTNSGYDRESICWHYHDYSRQVLDGTLENDAWFAFVCHLDPCETCDAAGHLQPTDDCPDCDDWKVEGPHWLKANPNLGVSLPWQYLREQVKQAIDLPSERSIVRRLNFCQWTQQAQVWIPLEKWTVLASKAVTWDAMKGRECYIGCDLSGKIDLSSVNFLFPRDLNRAETTAAVLAEGQADAPPIDRAVDLIAKFWMPKNTLERRAQEDNVPYPEWEKAGHLTATPGDLIDHDAIADCIIEASKLFHIRGIGVDQAGATAFVTRLQRHFGDELVIEVPQSFRHLSEPSKTYEALIVSGNLAHDGNPVMQMCVANVAIEENRWREIRPIKQSQRKRIDGVVAGIDALKVMQLTPPDAPSAYEQERQVWF